MRTAGTQGRFLSIFCALCCLGLLHTDARSERNQQTFVVRYKNGEQTIPVTVVLDYKKQTEYVINMSPRATTKTVTLYDFKQKTIAYKDLTNRECFLGRLTHESLSEETDALAKIQKPVEHQPKVLSLDPRRPSLTPTEIRNMAGQKTAVFCAKMNTWLVLPGEAHSIAKREVDEIDERTFHRHGYHTVHYSHYGRETRRRYRNPNSRQFFQTRKDNSEIPSWRAGNSETSSVPLESPSVQQHFLNPLPLETSLPGNDLRNPPQVGYIDPPGAIVKEASQLAPTFIPPLVAENSNSEATISPAFHSSGLNGQNGYDQQFSFNPTVTVVPNIEDQTGRREYNRKDSPQKIFENEKVLSVSNSETNSKSDHPFAHLAAQNPERTETKYLEFPHYTARTEKPDTNQYNEGHHHLNSKHAQNEDDSIPFGYDLNAISRKHYPKPFHEHAIPEDPDVSTNVLEIPKITEKFQNLDNPLHLSPVTQTNEDLHDVFEGFFNLRNSNSPSEQVLHGSHFVPSGPSDGEISTKSEESLTDSYPSFSQIKLNNHTDGKQQRREDEFNISRPSDVITSTDYPSLTTNVYTNHNGVAAPSSYWNSSSDYRTLKSKPENSENLHSMPLKFINRFRTDESTQPVNTKQENTLNRVEEGYFTTKNPSYVLTDRRDFDHRSDIPSENELTETIESFTPSSFNQNLPKTNERQDSLRIPAVSSQQMRFQNVLRNYKPDQIVIDLEKIPVQRPPESTLGFQGQVYSYNKDFSPSLPRNANGPNREQTSGGTWRGRPQHRTNHLSRKPHNLQPNGLGFHSRKNFIPQHYRSNESNPYQHRLQDNNIRPFVHSSQQILPHPSYTQRPFPKLDNLPPGVSIHPRHPKAPYADLVHSKVLPPVIPQGRTPKSHRQRHHKKKDRLCCRANGKTKSNPSSSCCRLSSHRGKSSCCSSTKHGKNGHIFPPRQKPVLISNASVPQQVRKQADDPRNRCQKEKLCRTLYESTQQVMVCRNAKIDGC